MDLERIEGALRARPPDEPMYVPGAFGRRSEAPMLLALASGALAIALVLGIGIGIGISVLRANGGTGAGIDPERLAADLKGTWTSEEVSRADVVTGLLELGYAQAEVDLALSSWEPFTSVRFRLDFLERHIQVFAAYDDGPFEGMSGGPYELRPGGGIFYDDIGCYMTIPVLLDADELRFGPMRTEGCNVDERLNNDAFFRVVDYRRADP